MMLSTVLDLNSTFKGSKFHFSGSGISYDLSMANWADRLHSAWRKKGWNIQTLSERSGVPYHSVRKYLEGKTAQPRGDRLSRLASTLEVDEQWLLYGENPAAIHIALIGFVGAAETWTPVDDHEPGDGLREVEIDLSDMDPVALEVRGSSMFPVYRDGDILLCSRRRGTDIASAIGKDCVIRTTEGEMLVKILQRDTGSLFRLRSYNPEIPDRVGVRLEWAAPVQFIKRR